MKLIDLIAATARAQAWPAIRLRGRLDRSPFRGETYETELPAWPLSRPHEYASIGIFEKPSGHPILLSPGQRDDWLAQLVTAARGRIPTMTMAVIRMGGPQGQLPGALLDRDVLLTHETRAAVERVIASGRSGVLEVWQDLRTDGTEDGANSIVITMHGAESVAAFLAFMAADRVLATLENSSIAEYQAPRPRSPPYRTDTHQQRPPT